jgi:prepilin-type N-terminal cleavage/methylation domain-containing protein
MNVKNKLSKTIVYIKENNKGFTLVELIVVIIILGILAATICPFAIKYTQQAREAKLLQNMRNSQHAAVSSLTMSLGGLDRKSESYNTGGHTFYYEAITNTKAAPTSGRPLNLYSEMDAGSISTPFEAILLYDNSKKMIVRMRYHDIGTEVVYEWTPNSGRWEILPDYNAGDDWTAPFTEHITDKSIWWNGSR